MATTVKHTPRDDPKTTVGTRVPPCVTVRLRKNERARKVLGVRRFWSCHALLRVPQQLLVCDVSVANLAITPRAWGGKLGVAIKMKLGSTGVGNCSADHRSIKIGVTPE